MTEENVEISEHGEAEKRTGTLPSVPPGETVAQQLILLSAIIQHILSLGKLKSTLINFVVLTP